MSYSKGIFWLDDCRIPFVDEKILIKSYSSNAMDIWYDNNKGERQPDIIKTNGRFTPNLLVCDDMLNDGSVSKADNGKSNEYDKNWNHYGSKYKQKRNAGFGDKGTNSRYYDLDLWFDKMLEGL